MVPSKKSVSRNLLADLNNSSHVKSSIVKEPAKSFQLKKIDSLLCNKNSSLNSRHFGTNITNFAKNSTSTSRSFRSVDNWNKSKKVNEFRNNSSSPRSKVYEGLVGINENHSTENNNSCFQVLF
jgi:hypothetical protein